MNKTKYKKPQEYAQELKDRIKELKAELAEIEPIYEALVRAGVKVDSKVKKDDCQLKICLNEELTPSEKIAEAQRKRHKLYRDTKVPKIIEFLRNNGPSSFACISRELRMTPAAIKKIMEENTMVFVKNKNQLWELHN